MGATWNSAFPRLSVAVTCVAWASNSAIPAMFTFKVGVVNCFNAAPSALVRSLFHQREYPRPSQSRSQRKGTTTRSLPFSEEAIVTVFHTEGGRARKGPQEFYLRPPANQKPILDLL